MKQEYSLNTSLVNTDQDIKNAYGYMLGEVLVYRATQAFTEAVCEEYAELYAEGGEDFLIDSGIRWIWRTLENELPSHLLGIFAGDLVPSEVEWMFKQVANTWNEHIYGPKWLRYFTDRGIPTPSRCPEEIFEEIQPAIMKILTSGVCKNFVGKSQVQ